MEDLPYNNNTPAENPGEGMDTEAHVHFTTIHDTGERTSTQSD